MRQQQSRRRPSGGQRFVLYIAVRLVDEVEVAEEVRVRVRVRVIRTGRMGGYVPIQVDWNVVQSGWVAWDLFSGRLPGIVLLLDLTHGFVLECGCLYTDVCGARTTAKSCWRQEVLVTRDRLVSLPYIVIQRRSGDVVAANLPRQIRRGLCL